MSLTKAESLAQIAHDWLVARRHPADIAGLLRDGCRELRLTVADVHAVRAEALR